MVIRPGEWLYISTMKNGTHSLYDSLTSPEVGGTRLGAGMHPIPPQRLAPIHFSVCRNPYDRAVSIWASTCVRESSRTRYEPYLYIEYNGGDPEQFRDFALYVLDNPDRPAFRNPWLYRNQSDWQDLFVLDRALHLENLAQELAAELGVFVSLGRGNASRRGHWQDYYTDVTRKSVQRWAGEDFERFDYAP